MGPQGSGLWLAYSHLESSTIPYGILVLAGPWQLLPSEDRPVHEQGSGRQHPQKESTEQRRKQFSAASRRPFEFRDPGPLHPPHCRLPWPLLIGIPLGAGCSPEPAGCGETSSRPAANMNWPV